jgi:hypothetical protein
MQSEFAMRRSVLRIELRRPVRSVLSFSVQNPCTALGLSAPESGHVMLVNVSGRPQCAWFCRGDMIKKPYNSAPPTRAQVNASTQEYAALALKYECLQPPEEWTAIVFDLTLETQMVDGELVQSFFDLLDRVAAEVQRRLLGDGEGVVRQRPPPPAAICRVGAAAAERQMPRGRQHVRRLERGQQPHFRVRAVACAAPCAPPLACTGSTQY